MKTVEAYSPHVSRRVSRRNKAQPVTTVVIHYTGSNSGTGAVAWFQNPMSFVSAHIVIDRDGRVYKCAKLGSDDEPGQTAWHAGEAKGPEGFGVNSYSLGVELAGKGDSFTEAQYRSLIEWLSECKKVFKGLKWITGHSDVCIPKGRKADPGPNFDMKRVADATGLKIWRRKQ